MEITLEPKTRAGRNKLANVRFGDPRSEWPLGESRTRRMRLTFLRGGAGLGTWLSRYVTTKCAGTTSAGFMPRMTTISHCNLTVELSRRAAGNYTYRAATKRARLQ